MTKKHKRPERGNFDGVFCGLPGGIPKETDIKCLTTIKKTERFLVNNYISYARELGFGLGQVKAVAFVHIGGMIARSEKLQHSDEADWIIWSDRVYRRGLGGRVAATGGRGDWVQSPESW